MDARYQRAIQALTQQGGWPLTAFLTPAGEVFYGGTYFPPDGMHGRPGFRTVLESVLDAYRSRRGQVRRRRRRCAAWWPTISTRRRRASRSRAARRRRVADGAGPRSRERRLRQAPKFPHPGAMTLLLHRWADQPGEPTRRILDRTLHGMARGGDLRPPGRRLPPLQRGRGVDRPPLREDVVRQFGAAQGLPRCVRGLRDRGVREGGARHRALGRDGIGSGGRLRREPGRRRGPRRRWRLLHLDPGRGRRRAEPEELEVAAAYYDIGTAARCITTRRRTCCSSRPRWRSSPAAWPSSPTTSARRSSARRRSFSPRGARGRRRSSIGPGTPTGTR